MPPSRAQFYRLPSPGAIEDGRRLNVQFNPTDYTLSKANQFAEVGVPGLDSPLLQFVRGQTEALKLDLFFDSTEEGTGAEATPVTTRTDQFYDLIKIDNNTHAPPVLLFTWGGTAFPGPIRNGFKCVVSSISQKYTFFSETGVPLRATLSVELKEYKTLTEQLQQLNLKSSDHTKVEVVGARDTLTTVAQRAYGGTGAEWRLIAEANDIDDPAAVPPGSILRIPRGEQ
ncbi:CIS tube protein [Arthrobacter humicola]